MSEPIDFYFDFISPYAYLGWTQIHGLAARHQRAVRPQPVLFAALLNANGQKGPAEIPRKRIYVFKDTLRTALHLGVPFGAPKSHPFNPLLMLRVCSLPMESAAQKTLIDACFHAVWGGPGRAVEEPEVVAAIATEAGLDGPALVAQATGEENKARLKATTETLLERGGFGVPSLWVDGELFWGLDAFPHVERRLEGKDPLSRIDLRQFAGIKPSATR
ncbi:MAG: 2-hydroxychromene-2-carboxylate isomerase [Myxococcota bacterium]